jgi:DNA repair protein RadC
MFDPGTSWRERLAQQGPGALADWEVLALLLRHGQGEEDTLALAQRLWARGGGWRRLARLDYNDWLQDLRPSQAAEVVAGFELGRRLARSSEAARPQIRQADDAARLVALEMEALRQEELRVMLLDLQQRLISIHTVYVGSVDLTLIRTAEVFRAAVVRNAVAMILIHNHPSGDPSPSPADLKLTQHLIGAAKLLDIAVLDHLIIGHGRWVSLKETGLAF